MEPRPSEPHAAPEPAKCTHCGAPLTSALGGESLCDSCQEVVPSEPRSHLRETDAAGCKLVHQLGAGRFSTSWLAEAPDGAPVVVKLLHAYAPDAGTVQRFVSEVQRVAGLAELEHPAVAPVVTGGVQLGSALFLVYRSGGDATLADELRARGRIAASRAVELCAQLAEGLASLHQAGILHLDLKPANVGLWRDAEGFERAVLLDAATAHLLAQAEVQDGGPLPLSTAAYVSPEEARGAVPDPRSDVYSLGALLFQCISGRLPVAGSTAEELTAAHVDQPAYRLRDVGRRAHPQLEAALARALAKDPERRFSGGEEMAAALRAVARVADQPSPAGEPEPPVEDPLPVLTPPAPAPAEKLDPRLERALLGQIVAEARPPARRHSWIRPAVAVAVLLMMVGGTVLLRHRRRPALPGPLVPVEETAAAPTQPASIPDRPSQSGGEQEEPDGPARAALRRAQIQVAAGDARGAQKTLQPLLAQTGLPRRDLSQAMRLMASAEARRGRRQAAIDWYRKSLRLTDDSADRERVVRIIQRLAHP